MSNKEAIALLRNLEDALDSYCELDEKGKTAFRMAIEALSCSEIPNSSDTISRQAAIDALENSRFPGAHYIDHGILIALREIKSLPSVDVQPVVHGEWIPVTAIYKVKEGQFPQTERVRVDATEPDEIDAVKCSICGEVFDFADARNWCTECGAKMDGKGADNV